MTNSLAQLESCAKFHLDAYTDPQASFAFATYDRWYSSPDTLTPLDCFAANLLSLKLGYGEVIPLFREGESSAAVLRQAMQRVLDNTAADGPCFLRMASIEDETFKLLRAANTCAESVPEWTAVTVCKVLHRLRPHFVPVYDSVARDFYCVPQKSPARFFEALHRDIRENEDWLRRLVAGRCTPDGRPLSVLRAADIVIWHHSHEGGC